MTAYASPASSTGSNMNINSMNRKNLISKPVISPQVRHQQKSNPKVKIDYSSFQHKKTSSIYNLKPKSHKPSVDLDSQVLLVKKKMPATQIQSLKSSLVGTPTKASHLKKPSNKFVDRANDLPSMSIINMNHKLQVPKKSQIKPKLILNGSITSELLKQKQSALVSKNTSQNSSVVR